MRALRQLLVGGTTRYKGLIKAIRAMSTAEKAPVGYDEEGTPKGSLPIGDIPSHVQEA